MLKAVIVSKVILKELTEISFIAPRPDGPISHDLILHVVYYNPINLHSAFPPFPLSVLFTLCTLMGRGVLTVTPKVKLKHTCIEGPASLTVFISWSNCTTNRKVRITYCNRTILRCLVSS